MTSLRLCNVLQGLWKEFNGFRATFVQFEGFFLTFGLVSYFVFQKHEFMFVVCSIINV